MLAVLKAASVTPYSLRNHFAVAGSRSARLISLPCFLQKPSNDLSVTNQSTSFNWPEQISSCTCATVTSRRSAVRSQENAASSEAKTAAVSSRTAADKDAAFFSQHVAKELTVTRGSRTRKIPFPMRHRSRAGPTRRSLHKARNDHPSVTLALSHCSKTVANCLNGTAHALGNLLDRFIPG